MYRKILLIISLPLILHSGIISAQEKSIAGRWKVIDEKNGKEKSIVLVWIDEEGNLNGKIEKLFRKHDEDPNPICDQCEGDKKDAPLSGMQILWGFIPDHKRDDNVWNSGKMLDTKTGIVYNCNLRLDETGDRLEVQSFIGFSMIGKKQIWVRIIEE